MVKILLLAAGPSFWGKFLNYNPAANSSWLRTGSKYLSCPASSRCARPAQRYSPSQAPHLAGMLDPTQPVFQNFSQNSANLDTKQLVIYLTN